MSAPFATPMCFSTTARPKPNCAVRVIRSSGVRPLYLLAISDHLLATSANLLCVSVANSMRLACVLLTPYKCDCIQLLLKSFSDEIIKPMSLPRKCGSENTYDEPKSRTPDIKPSQWLTTSLLAVRPNNSSPS